MCDEKTVVEIMSIIVFRKSITNQTNKFIRGKISEISGMGVHRVRGREKKRKSREREREREREHVHVRERERKRERDTERDMENLERRNEIYTRRPIHERGLTKVLPEIMKKIIKRHNAVKREPIGQTEQIDTR